MRVHMVAAVLRVILDHEDRGLGPELGARDGLYHHAEGEVVVRDLCGGGELVRMSMPLFGISVFLT